MTSSNNHIVIMAGGVGSRFWPMSTPECPKQFVDPLGCGRTLLQLTVDRFDGIVPPENVWVVTSAAYCELVAEQLPNVPHGNILCEPCRRNTAPCICYAAWRIKMKDPKACIVVTPSDHIVMNVPEFQRVVSSSLLFASETDAIITLGIKPSRPETGYGYIQADLASPSARNRELYRVDMFREKPDLKTAEHYISRGNFFWNAGIFIMNVSTIVNAFRIYQPEISGIFEGMQQVYGTKREQEVVNQQFPLCPNVSVDYAIMEKAEEIFVFPAEFGWSDLGTWGSLLVQSQRDSKGNALIGPRIDTYDTKNCIVHTTGMKRVVVQGLEGYIVAEKGGTLLVCRLSEEQHIKEWSE